MQKKITTGVTVTINRTQRWETNVLTCHFIGAANKISNTALTLLTRILNRGCQPYPQNDQLNLKLAHLYGANLQVDHQLFGDWHDLYFEISYVDPEANGTIGQQVLQLLQQLIFEPLLGVAHFGVQAFEIEYRALKNELTDLANDHDFQAFALTKAAFFEQGNLQQPTIGSLAELAEIDYGELIQLYQEVLNNWRVEIVASGQYLPTNTILTTWPFSSRTPQLPTVAVKASFQEVQRIHQEVVGQQTHLVLAYHIPDLTKATNHQRDVLRLLVACLGENEQSLLFQQVREQAGLAYDISIHEDLLLGWLVIEAGVDRRKRDEAISTITSVVQSVTDKIDSQLLQAEVTSLLNRQLRSMDDIRFVQAMTFRNVLFPERARDFAAIQASLTAVTPIEIEQLATQLQLGVVTIVENQEVQSE